MDRARGRPATPQVGGTKFGHGQDFSVCSSFYLVCRNGVLVAFVLGKVLIANNVYTTNTLYHLAQILFLIDNMNGMKL